jgi:hypothetical protein
LPLPGSSSARSWLCLGAGWGANADNTLAHFNVEHSNVAVVLRDAELFRKPCVGFAARAFLAAPDRIKGSVRLLFCAPKLCVRQTAKRC